MVFSFTFQIQSSFDDLIDFSTKYHEWFFLAYSYDTYRANLLINDEMHSVDFLNGNYLELKLYFDYTISETGTVEYYMNNHYLIIKEYYDTLEELGKFKFF